MNQPNILFILSDDQGAWAMRCAGNADIQTPNLDRIAANGAIFDFCIEKEDMDIIDTLNQDYHCSHVPEDLADTVF